jgi:hypothetical protein
VLEHEGKSFVTDTSKADVFVKHYASASHHKFSRAERKTDHAMCTRLTEDLVIRLSQAISDGFQAKKPANQTVLALLDFLKEYNKVWWADLLATMLRKGVPVH